MKPRLLSWNEGGLNEEDKRLRFRNMLKGHRSRCSFKNFEDQFTWTFAGVYGPNYDCHIRFLCDELARLHSW